MGQVGQIFLWRVIIVSILWDSVYGIQLLDMQFSSLGVSDKSSVELELK